MDEWYFARDGVSDGPHSEQAFIGMVRSGEIAEEALVWKDGFDGWTPLADVEALRSHVRRRPPPLPGARVVPSQTAVPPVVPPAQEPREIDEVSPASLSRAGPWSRYFARMFDLTITATASGFVLGLTLAWTSPTAYAAFEGMDARFTGLLFLAIAYVVNGFIVHAFGNSLGKRIFGLKAVPVEAGIGGLGWVLKREGRVWLYGSAVGIPIIALFTMIRNFRAVRERQPAYYDRGHSEVIGRSIGTARRSLGMILSIATFIGAFALDRWAEIDNRTAPSQPAVYSWTNPITSRTASIPVGWTTGTQTADDGSNLMTFTRADGNQMIYFGDEASPDGMTLAQYAGGIEKAAAKDVDLKGAWRSVSLNGRQVMRKDGLMAANKLAVSYVIWRDGDRFWRVVLVTSRAGIDAFPDNVPAVRAVMSSVP